MADGQLERDPVVQRAIESLRALPRTNAESVARVVAAAARARAQDVAPDEDDLLPNPVERAATRGRRFSMVAAIAAAVLFVSAGLGFWRLRVEGASSGVVVKDVHSESQHPASFAAATGAQGENTLDAVPILTQFVFDGRARHVSLVGDFNNWDERATPLEREGRSTLWSVTVPIQRGRHIYAFMVDSVWTVDKRAPVARDPDFGVTGSVILVGRP